MSDFIIPEEEQQAMAAEGLTLGYYTREIVVDASVPRELQRLLTLCLGYVPPDLRREVEGALSWRFE